MDMSQWVKDWKVGGGDDEPREISGTTEARLTCPADKPVTLEVAVKDVEPPCRGKIVLVQGTTPEEELWAVRMDHTGRLFLHLGTAGRRETEVGYYPDFCLDLSYNPMSGAISLSVREPEGPRSGPLAGVPSAVVLTGAARNQWSRYVERQSTPPKDWQLCLGCPLDGRADQPPIGWTISASFRFGEGAPKAQEHAHTVTPRDAWTAQMATSLFNLRALVYDASRDRVYAMAAEGADHTELSAEWHLGVLAGARSMGWKGGAA